MKILNMFFTSVLRCVGVYKAAVLCLLLSFTAVLAETEEQSFDDWLVALRAEAITKGISADTVNSALAEVVFKERVITSDRAQAEFKETYSDYINKRVGPYRITQGQKYMTEHGDVVAKVTREYGVPARFVVAIIGVETNYGTYKLSHSLFDVLSTLAFDKRRGARFRKEIFAALTMIDKGYASVEQLKSSWAGALGVPQFMPTTYLDYAVDHDKDGKIDIWNHGPDLYASVANYLKRYGWDSNTAWARKVIIPKKQQLEIEREEKNRVDIPKVCKRYDKHLKGWKSLPQWSEIGLTRMNKSALPSVDLAASLIITQPDFSHGYLVYENFCTLMRYNPSFKYALSVGALSDELK